MCMRVGTLKIPSVGNFRHRNLKIYFEKDRKKTTYEWHILSSDVEKHSKTLGVGSKNALHAGLVRSKVMSGCLVSLQPTILLTV